MNVFKHHASRPTIDRTNNEPHRRTARSVSRLPLVLLALINVFAAATFPTAATASLYDHAYLRTTTNLLDDDLDATSTATDEAGFHGVNRADRASIDAQALEVGRGPGARRELVAPGIAGIPSFDSPGACLPWSGCSSEHPAVGVAGTPTIRADTRELSAPAPAKVAVAVAVKAKESGATGRGAGKAREAMIDHGIGFGSIDQALTMRLAVVRSSNGASPYDGDGSTVATADPSFLTDVHGIVSLDDAFPATPCGFKTGCNPSFAQAGAGGSAFGMSTAGTMADASGTGATFGSAGLAARAPGGSTSATSGGGNAVADAGWGRGIGRAPIAGATSRIADDFVIGDGQTAAYRPTPFLAPSTVDAPLRDDSGAGRSRCVYGACPSTGPARAVASEAVGQPDRADGVASVAPGELLARIETLAAVQPAAGTQENFAAESIVDQALIATGQPATQQLVSGTAVSALQVPEPSTVLLMLGTLLFLVGVGRGRLARPVRSIATMQSA